MPDSPAPATADAPSDIGVIGHYHAHIYYDPASSRDRAQRLRERVARRFRRRRSGAGTTNWSGRACNRCIRSPSRARFCPRSCRG